MKRLYLIRHAKSSWSDPGLPDFERGLNKRGKRDAPFMGKRLANHGIRPDLILASPAKRAKKTAGIIAKAIGYSKKKIIYHEEIYSHSVKGVLQLIRAESDQTSFLFLVGHNPVITDLAELLTSHRIMNVPTSGIVAVILSVDRWEDTVPGMGELEFFDYPKKHLSHD